MKKYTIEMFEKRCKEIANEIKKNKNIKYISGIHRGGLIPAIRISHLTGIYMVQLNDMLPPDKVAIIDDVIDTGKTREMYEEYDNYFVLVDKNKEKIKDWIEFWWEEQ
jgi:adenine/guanine phosphoribosyltransferase-like PRPP-binding protein